jgi:hypothetical protein
LESRKNHPDLSVTIKQWFRNAFRSRSPPSYNLLESEESDDLHSLTSDELSEKLDFSEKPPPPRLPFRHIWTPTVFLSLLTLAIFDFHMGAFNNLWSLFLSSARSTPLQTSTRHLPFLFTGGLNMPAATVGFATAILGIIGLSLQFTLYPSIHKRLGTVRCYRYFCFFFPIAYFLAPYLSIIPSASPPPAEASGLLIWLGISFILFFQVLARTFCLPATLILLNNCSPHPSVLGSIHGVGQAVSAAFRTIGPLVSGFWFGFGLRHDVIGFAWWGVSGVAVVGWVGSRWVREGSGHEVKLAGERGEER